MVLLIATRNEHKAGEIHAILGDQFQLVTLNAFPNAPEVVEDAGTFAGNATKKATELAKWLAARQPPPDEQNRAGSVPRIDFVLADDSGLEVDALHGAPGVHSARFAALDTGAVGNSSTTQNNAKLLRLLQPIPAERRTARFRCVLALTPVLAPAPAGSSPVCAADEFELQTETFEGICEGRIVLEKRGSGGFGYDPLFVPDGFDQTFGELGEEVKNKLSHRARALARFKAWMESAPE